MDSKTQYTNGPHTVHRQAGRKNRYLIRAPHPDYPNNQEATLCVASDLRAGDAALFAAAPTMYEGIGDFLAAYDRARIGDWDHGKLIDWLGEQVARLQPVYAKAEGR